MNLPKDPAKAPREKKNIIHNISALYVVYITSYLLPLVTIPYLTRVLGPDYWGLIAFAQSFGQYFVLIIEYGFTLSATREVAQQRDNMEKLSELFAGVMGAKFFLILISFSIGIIAKPFIPVFEEHSYLFWLAYFWAISQSLNPLWYFQGLEKMRLVATLDVVAKTIATLCVFIFIHEAKQAPLFLVFQGIASFLSTFVAFWISYRDLHFRFPTLASTKKALSLGWTLFLFKSAVSFYTVGNTFILGLFVAPTYVGYYAGAEKISKALLGLLNPVAQALYPRMNHLITYSKIEAAKLAQKSLKFIGAGSIALGLATFLLSPFLVKILLGHEFQPASHTLKILAMLIPMIAISNVLGIQWMIPLKLDRFFNTIIILAGSLNIVLAVILAPLYSYNGMAWAVVISEVFVTIGMYAVLVFKKLSFKGIITHGS